MLKNEELKTANEILFLLNSDLRDGESEIISAGFSRDVKKGKIPTHSKRGSPKKFYYYSEVRPNYSEKLTHLEVVKKTDELKEVNTEENNEELAVILQEAQTAVQKVQIIKDFWTGKINQQKYEVEKGLYYAKEEIDKEAERILVNFRNKVLGMATKIAPALLGLEDIPEAESIVYDACYEILEELGSLDAMV